MRIAGIDWSLASTAVMVVDRDTGEIHHQETKIGYSLPKNARWWERADRVAEIVRRSFAIVEEHQVELLAYEGPSLGSRGASLFFAGELHSKAAQGYRLLDTVGTILEAPPSCLKKFATGNGSSGKPAVAAHVARRWDHIFKDDNLTDAYVLCQIGRAMSGVDLTMPKANRSGLDKVLRYVQDSRADMCNGRGGSAESGGEE